MQKALRTALILAIAYGGIPAFAGSPAVLARIDIPSDTRVDGHVIGGLSGVDFDPRSHRLVFIEDDNAAHVPIAKLIFDAGRYRLAWESAHRLQVCGGAQDRQQLTADGESIRLDGAGGLVWASEGRFKAGVGPAVTFAAADGSCRADMPLPAMLQFDPKGNAGPAPNKVFEGLSFAPDGHSFWVAMEDALLQDGPRSTRAMGGLARISRFNRSGKLLRQIAYRLDPIQSEGVAGIADNGISEILSDTDGTLLVLERSGARNAAGHFDFYSRIYRVDPATAEDIQALPTLAAQPAVAVRKTLVLNLATVDDTLPYNFEGMAWGPAGKAGARTLLLVSDNGFEDIPSRIMVLSFASTTP